MKLLMSNGFIIEHGLKCIECGKPECVERRCFK